MPVISPGAGVQSPGVRSSSATEVMRSATDRCNVDSVAVARALDGVAPTGGGTLPVRAMSSDLVFISASAPVVGAYTNNLLPDGVTATAPSGSFANSGGRSTQFAD